MLDGAPKTPWRLRDYDDSPQLLQPPKRQRYSVPSSMQPPAQVCILGVSCDCIVY